MALFERERRAQPGTGDPEAGFILLAVLFLVAALMIGLAVAVPQITRSIQRDKELELIHRGEQYKRAIKLYYKKYGAYPTSMDQLVNTNQIRFLRKRYTDPITGKDDWKLVLMGQAHLRPLGFFGQPLSVGGVSSSIGMSTGNIYAVGCTPVSGAGSLTDSGSGASTDSGASSSSSSAGSGCSSDGSGSGSSDTSGSSFGSSNSGSSNTGSSFGGSSFGSSSTGSSPFSSSTGTGSGFGSTSGSSSSGSSSSGSTLGGVGPFVGVVIPSTKVSLVEYKKQKHYNQWEFIYDPVEDQMQAAGALGGAGSAGSLNGPGQSSSPFGGTSSSPFGSSTTGPGGFASPAGGGSTPTSGSSDSGSSGSSPTPNP